MLSKEIFSCFSFVLYLELFSRVFLPFQARENYTLTKHKSVEEEKKQIGKKFYFVHDKSSSYWIIESKRKKVFWRGAEDKKIEDLQQVKINFLFKKA